VVAVVELLVVNFLLQVVVVLKLFVEQLMVLELVAQQALSRQY
jgi:hypothetical protein